MNYPELRECDSLAARVRRIWSKTYRHVIVLEAAYDHPLDGAPDWGSAVPIPMTRKQAADALRIARQRGYKIERSQKGYEVSGGTNPAWRYTA